ASAVDGDPEDDKSGILAPPYYKILSILLLYRAINSLLVQTYFNPDEHWQALEVAHRIAFGYGHLTWEWTEGLRSYLHPLLFAALYKVMAFFGIDTPWFMARAPRFLQSIFAAIGDLYLYKYSLVIFGESVANWALFAQLSNWFMFFCITRTFSNTMETVLTIVSFYYWPCMKNSRGSSSSRKYALLVAGLACAIRPTSAITWIYVGFLELFSTRDKLRFVLLEVAPIGGFILGVAMLLDRLIYGSWVIVPLNFLKFNFFSSGGDYYGTHPWHWYMSQGFTVMIFTFLPFSLHGIILSQQWKISGLMVWILGVYSLLGHKEFRFVLPVLPIALMFSGYSLANLTRSGHSSSSSSTSHGRSSAYSKTAVWFLIVTNFPMALYMSMIHQRGTEDVMKYLSEEASLDRVRSILFLMPCHSTPYYSSLHRDVPMRFLDCSPSGRKDDESDEFVSDPLGFATEFARSWSRPSHIVMFDSEEGRLREFLASHHFSEERRFFHSHFKVDREELQASVAVYI
ncbi:hypothetical protein M569_13558, partial [Genlisea aurea]